jgi:hypothetical protein
VALTSPKQTRLPFFARAHLLSRNTLQRRREALSRSTMNERLLVGAGGAIKQNWSSTAPTCSDSQVVNEALEDSLREAEALLVELGAVSLANWRATSTSAGAGQRRLRSGRWQVSPREPWRLRARLSSAGRGSAIPEATRCSAPIRVAPPSSRTPTRRAHPKPTSWRQAGLPRCLRRACLHPLGRST